MRKLNNLASALFFYIGVTFTKLKGWWRPTTKQFKKAKITQIALKEGDSYRLGECIVTLAKFGVEGKLEIAKKLEAYNTLRELRHRELTDKAEKIMLMSPEELKTYQIEEWLKQRKSFNEKKYYENLK